MIIRWLDTEIKERKSLAAILKNGSHFVLGTNLRWPYILKSSLGHILLLCQVSNFYHEVHDALKFWRIPLPLMDLKGISFNFEFCFRWQTSRHNP